MVDCPQSIVHSKLENNQRLTVPERIAGEMFKFENIVIFKEIIKITVDC